jgi:hypothetical protein
VTKPDLWIALAALVIGIPAFILLFRGPTWAVGIITVLLLLVVFLALAYVRWTTHKPHFTIAAVDKELVFHNADCKVATLTRRQTAVANHRGISEFWCRNIASDGGIDNIQVDGAAPSEHRHILGEVEVCKRFDRPLERGQSFTTVLSYDLIDSFPRNREQLIHVVEGRTGKLRLAIRFPAGKNIKDARAFLKFGGEERSQLDGLEVSQSSLVLEIRRPKFGADYVIEWNW